MKYSAELHHWTKISDVSEARKKILTDDDWNERTKKDIKKIQDALNITKEDTVIDFGCGIGRLMKEIAPFCLKVLGIDVSDDMIKYGVNYCQGIANCFFMTMISESVLEVEKESIEKIYSLLVMQHIEKPKALHLLREFIKVLKPGGKAYIQYPNVLNKEFYFIYMKKKRQLDGLDPLMEFYTREELEMIFKEVGFKVIRMEDDGKDYYVLLEKPKSLKVSY